VPHSASQASLIDAPHARVDAARARAIATPRTVVIVTAYRASNARRSRRARDGGGR